MTDYRELLIAAWKRSHELGLFVPPGEKGELPTKFVECYPHAIIKKIAIEVLREGIRATAGRRGSNSSSHSILTILGYCHVNALKLQGRLLNELGLPSLITIGELLVEGEPQYGATLDVLQAERTGQVEEGKPLPFHVWVTLTDFTIVDLTGRLSYIWHKKGRVLSTEEAVILLTPNSKNSKFQYHPLILGADYLEELDPGLSYCREI